MLEKCCRLVITDSFQVDQSAEKNKKKFQQEVIFNMDNAHSVLINASSHQEYANGTYIIKNLKIKK